MTSRRALPPEAFDRPAAETARRIALGHLDDAVAARVRLESGEGAEALHDLRVALRRLRCTIRTFRPELSDSVRRRDRRRLRALARSTSGGRDAEVQLAWLRAQTPTLATRHRAGAAWLRERIAASEAVQAAVVRDVLAANFGSLARTLGRRLGRWRVTVQLDEPVVPPTAAQVLGARLVRLVRRFARLLDDVRDPTDRERSHAARIAAKRLRYALEPLVPTHDEARALVERLKTLQDTLGELHDAHVLADVVADSLEAAARDAGQQLSQQVRRGAVPARGRSSGRDPRPGLLELARRLQAEARARFDAVEGAWRGAPLARFVDDAMALAGALARRHAPGTEVERKYLLDAMPELPPGAVVEEIAQGYLPGANVTERVRAVTRDGATHWVRTVKSGTGIARTELEDRVSRAMFDALWALTTDRRLRKRRHLVTVGDDTWTVDEFLDRPLVLAEIELATADDEVVMPDWLAPHLVREVTGEAAYQNAQLAGASPRLRATADGGRATVEPHATNGDRR